MPSNRSDLDLSCPLLQDDELGSYSPLSHTGFEDEDGETSKKRNVVRGKLKLVWRHHKRRIVVGLSYTAAALLLTLMILIVIAPKAPKLGGDVPPFNETLAYDPRLEKYQSPDETASCPSWSTPIPSTTSKFISSISFTLPSDPSLTFFLTRGAPVQGTFIINRERTRGKEFTVDVIAEYDDEDNALDVLKNTKACFAGQTNGGHEEQGILLWSDPTSNLIAPSPHVRFNISVHLPDIQQFNDISTDFTNPGTIIAHEIADIFDLWRPTTFDAVRLNAKNARISAGNLLGPAVYASTTNAPLIGGFWVSEDVHLQTSNAPVKATIFAVGQTSNASTSVTIRTESAPVFAAIAITSDFSHVKLNTSIHTTDGELTVYSPRAMVTPYPSVYILHGSTTNAPASLYLHPEYEGSFELSTAGVGLSGKAELVWDDNAGGRDPAGKGRTRRLDWSDGRKERRWKSGKIVWGEEVEEERMGDVRLYTTGKDVTVVAQKAQ